MKINIIIPILLSMFSFSVKKELYGQKLDTLKILSSLPVKCGYLLPISKDTSLRYLNPTDGVRVYSFNCDSHSVFSISDGKILSVFKENGDAICIVKSSKEIYYTYAYLSNCNLKKGMRIKKGNYLGSFRDSIGSKEFIQIIVTEKGEIMSLEKTLKLLNKI